jgi:epoxyqueuosine reductase
MSTVFRGTAEAEAVRRAHEHRLADEAPSPDAPRLTAAQLRELCRASGADDAGFVEVARAPLAEQREPAERLLPGARTLVSLVIATNRDNLRAPPRSVANSSFHHDGERLAMVADDIGRALRRLGVRAVRTTVGFPMEAGRWTSGSIWEIAHKPVAVEAGLGHMGINRNVIHPRFGNFVLLDTLVIDAELDAYDTPLDYNPCADCNLCVAACPVGAISRTDDFDFFACLNHNYREFLGGFADWADTLAGADSADEYRTKFREDETVSLWQSLGYGPQYKSAYCMAVCPAGTDVIGPYLRDRRGYVATYLRPLRNRPEPVYVQSGTRAERVAARNPAKQVRYIDYKVGLASVDNILRGLQHMFDGTRAPLDGTTIRCVIEGDSATHEILLAVQNGSLRVLHAGDDAPTEQAEPTATARGPLSAWMDLLVHAAAGHPTGSGELTISGAPATFDSLVHALHDWRIARNDDGATPLPWRTRVGSTGGEGKRRPRPERAPTRRSPPTFGPRPRPRRTCAVATWNGRCYAPAGSPTRLGRAGYGWRPRCPEARSAETTWPP